MPKTRYNEVKIIKKRGKFRFVFKLMSFLLVVFGFGMLLAEVFMPAGSTFVFSSADSISFKQEDLFALSLGEYSELTEAEEVANVAGSWGAGAYIAQLKGKYYVIGCVYSSLEDSEKVEQNLGQTNYNTQSIKLEFDKVKFSIKGIEKENKEIIKNSLEMFKDTYKNLYQVTMKLDKSEITNIVASGQVNSIKSEVRVARLKLATLNTTYSLSELTKINDALIKLEEGLDVCVNQLLSNSYVNHAIKNCLCNCVFLEYNLVNNF